MEPPCVGGLGCFEAGFELGQGSWRGGWSPVGESDLFTDSDRFKFSFVSFSPVVIFFRLLTSYLYQKNDAPSFSQPLFFMKVCIVVLIEPNQATESHNRPRETLKSFR